MSTEIQKMNDSFVAILKKHIPSLKISIDTKEKFEVTGTIEAMQGKKKVDGIYFASVVPKPKDVRFYFFPIYTHADDFKDISEQLRKCLKGKSCFHVKKLDDSLVKDFTKLIAKGISLYKKDRLLK